MNKENCALKLVDEITDIYIYIYPNWVFTIVVVYYVKPCRLLDKNTIFMTLMRHSFRKQESSHLPIHIKSQTRTQNFINDWQYAHT